ncbi:MAG: hypothetical protein CMJ62_01870 [Planctomycetaceae bacterium]|nr:hypothetical protein [Planctomycetaceae bacterium]
MEGTLPSFYHVGNKWQEGPVARDADWLAARVDGPALVRKKRKHLGKGRRCWSARFLRTFRSTTPHETPAGYRVFFHTSIS